MIVYIPGSEFDFICYLDKLMKFHSIEYNKVKKFL